MQEINNKIRLLILSCKFELKVVTIEDANGKILADIASIHK